jgi:predicted dehydrogenase
MKLCMIGLRGHYGYVLQGLPLVPQVQVVGVSAGIPDDKPEPLLKQCSELGHHPRAFDDYRQMLDTMGPELLVVSGPLHLHASICIDAFQRGIHVFCEKPVALTLEELAAVEEALAMSGVHLAAMMGLRYAADFYTAWRAVRQGAVGQIRLIHSQKSYRLGDRPEYYRRRATYGGTIPWVGSHAIDWIHWFSGAEFTSVYASHSTACNRGNGDLEMSALCQFTLTGDVFATASIDYLRPAAASTHGDDRVRVAGTEGVIEVRGGQVLLTNAEGEQALAADCPRQIFADFLGHVLGKGEALISSQDTLAVTRACLLARESADQAMPLSFGHNPPG